MTADLNCDIFFEDISVGSQIRVGDYQVSEDEIIAFGRAWDPLPIHVDPIAAKQSRFGGLTAPGCLILAIKQLLVHELPLRQSVVSSLGFDEVRFLNPLRPGDRVSVEVEWLSKRPSLSNPGCGVVTLGLKLVNQRNETVVQHKDSVLMRLRTPAASNGR